MKAMIQVRKKNILRSLCTVTLTHSSLNSINLTKDEIKKPLNSTEFAIETGQKQNELMICEVLSKDSTLKVST